MNNFFCKAFGNIQVGFVILVALFFFAMFLKLVLEPLAPMITIFFVLILTVNTFDRWMTAVSSVAGIILYVVSWYVFVKWGYWYSVPFWSAGILIWFTTVFWSFLKSKHYSSAKEITV